MRTDEDATFSRRGRGPYVIGAALILGFLLAVAVEVAVFVPPWWVR